MEPLLVAGMLVLFRAVSVRARAPSAVSVRAPGPSAGVRVS